MSTAPLRVSCCAPRCHSRSIRTTIAAGLLWLIAAAPVSAAPSLKIDDSELPRKKQPQLSYKDVVERIAPSVVTIYSDRTVSANAGVPGAFSDPFFQQFFGRTPSQSVPQERQERSLGSGVIVSKEGYIITNSHVVDRADRIRVALPNSTRELDAEVVGSDPQTDIAVLKVQGKNLTAATLADSDKLAVGDVVLAVGNPFNVGQTVTVGIAGAIGRGGMGLGAYEDFIQTDASINPGNSGGALVDGLGRVVGINTAILSRTGGNQGVGFAVPINLARHVFDQIATNGSVTRGYLGVVVQPVTEELAREFGLDEPRGALIADVAPGQPAAAAGLQPGDVIVSFGGTAVEDARNLQLLVAEKEPRAEVKVEVLREGKSRSFDVTLATQPRGGLAGGSPGSGMAPGGAGDLFTGLEVQDLDANVRRQLGVPGEVKGAVISAVAPDSAAAAAGLEPGNVIVGINHQAVQNAEEAIALSREIDGDRVLLRVWSERGTAFVVLSQPDAEE